MLVTLHVLSDSITNLLSTPFVRISFGARSEQRCNWLLKFGTHSSLLSRLIVVVIPSIVTSAPTISSKLSIPLNAFPLAFQIRFLLTIMCMYKLYLLTFVNFMPSVLWHCCLGVRKSIRSVKTEWRCVGVFLDLERRVVQLMPLHPRTPSSVASFKSRLVLPFWYRLTQHVLEKRLLKGCSVVVVLLWNFIYNGALCVVLCVLYSW